MSELILALDLGTHTGWACRGLRGEMLAGTWDFVQKKGPCCAVDPRLVLFRQKLVEETRIDLLVYEDVQFMRGRAQAFLWSGFRTVLWLFAHDYNIPIICCPVKTLKKFATGNGNADKDEMASALFLRDDIKDMPANVSDLDDNAVDAVHLLRWAEGSEGVLTKPKKSTP